MRKLLRLLLPLTLFLLSPVLAKANQNIQGWCESGAQPVVTSGLTSTTQVQQSFPACTVTIFIHGGGLATIFSDNSGTPLSNPFTATSNGRWLFYAANGRYDVQLSGAGFPSPVTYSDISIADPANQQAALPNTNLSFSSTPAFNATNNVSYTMTLTGNVTSSTITGTPANGNILSLTLIEDAIGSRPFAFPSNFILPLGFSFNQLALATNALTWKFDGTNWNLISNSGSGGGGNPAPPANSLQKNNGSGALAASIAVDNGTAITIPSSGLKLSNSGFASTLSTATLTANRTFTLPNLNLTATGFVPAVAGCGFGSTATCDTLFQSTTSNNSALSFSSTDSGVSFTNSVALASLGAASGGSILSVTAVSTNPGLGNQGIQSLVDVLGSGNPIATGVLAVASDDPLDTNAGQELIAMQAQVSLTKPSSSALLGVGLQVTSPFNRVGGVSSTETATNLYGLQVQDQRNLGTTRTSALQIDAQTASAHAFAITTDGTTPSLFGGQVTSSTGFTSPAFNLTGGGNTATLSGSFSATRTATLPNNTGTLAELNLAQTWTDHQSIANGKAIRWFSTNGTNYAGFTGGASTVNLVWLFPTTDSSGTQCLSSNGSLQLSWSACSAGTGTPGGANTQVQFNNSGSFGGSANLTWVSPTLTIGVAASTTGQLAMAGATSGTVTITPQAIAGTPTLTLPNTSGTFADGASAPLVLSATTGNLTCPTCTTNAAALTNNQIVLGAGGQATQIGPAGTTTTVLHGNAAGAPTYAAVNLGTDTTGTTAIANGGTGQVTASAAFNALSPVTSTGDLILGTGVNTAGRLGIGTNGLCLVSNGSTATWNSCAAGAVGGTGSAGQGTFWNTSSAVTGSANWTYSATSGHTILQPSNGVDTLTQQRFTNSGPTGNFENYKDTSGTTVYKVDVSGNVTGTSFTGIGSGASYIDLPQTSAPPLGTNSARIYSPTSIPSSYAIVLPGSAATGFLRASNVSSVATLSFLPASGVGGCSPTTVVTAANDNTSPTCSNITGGMFGSQNANSFLVGPTSGAAAAPTFRLIVAADILPINLNSNNTNGGVTGTLPVTNGGCGASTALACFNNLSPLTMAGDILYGGTSGSGTRLAAGTATQLLHSGTTPSWSAVSLTADVTGTLPFGNGGTNASSGLANTNGFIYSDGTKLVSTATGGAGTLCAISVSGGTPSWGSCAGSASTVWSSLSNPAADLSLSMGTNNSLFTHGVMTGTRNAWEIVDGASTSTGALMFLHTAASSTLKPFKATAVGTANGVQMDTTGSLAAIGTGAIVATSTTLTINTTSPITGGAALTSNLTLACATCVTSGSALTNNQVVIGSGGGQGAASLAAGTSKQILTAGSPPAYIDFPDYHYFPAADCVNAVAASGWSTAATPAATCRAGTNNKEGFLTWGASDTAQMSIGLPADWDTATNPNVRLRLASTDATNGHTVIMQIATACSKGDGSTTDDVAFNTAQSLSTITLNGNANRQWDATLSTITMTGCIAGGVLRLQLSRTTDTATNVEIYGLGITIPRLLTVQAN